MVLGPSGLGVVQIPSIAFLVSQDEPAEFQHVPVLPKSPDSFQLKHIFHHGMGDKFRIHRRLDVTPAYLEKHRSHFEALVLATSNKNDEGVDTQHLESVYNQMDWPKVHHGKNPFDIKLSIKKAQHKGVAMRLKERHTPGFLDTYLAYAMRVKGLPAVLNKIHLEWEEDTEVEIPDVKDKDTVVSLATISSNAYVRFPEDDDEKRRLDWIDVGGWIPDEDHPDINFGWEDAGMRGHVFVSEDNKTVVIGIKGTSAAGLPGSGPEETVPDDKVNDNLLFSCCCARISYLWTTVCDCYEKTYTCNQDCLEKELMRQDRYYQATLDLYRNVTALYPPENHTIWVTGHSLGGALASLLGRTYGLPVVAYEAPGEMLATKRLHLPQPPGLPKHRENIWHFGNTADPIYMGVCNGASSLCNVAGYAMETACHTGKQCVYDVVTDKGWRVNLLNHRIHTVIDEIILKYNETAPCEEQPPCRDCFNWRFTSHDDDEDDEPFLPNPLKPRPHRSTSSHKQPAVTTTSTAEPDPEDPGPPKKCLNRTWYGWCTEWGHDDDS
ncbi:alpha/beta-hydrolase [Suhomyces tanzawaensis NRRL Y-17324]|uniref:Putative lipase ATG15 n=1 Tax=Suhomyces tanzawaensis NRRL Y-17324 TaxID=984487 RepID=A0A1E4SQZ8_9ASCO|nr:alpha/beta-hydrolase [Suhomyces tanzawaensis NRRL Y-17324]ODV81867.1 alpha/beta-hydrolase [Suhomyces tanzawaensis NRRL Y-17324]